MDGASREIAESSSDTTFWSLDEDEDFQQFLNDFTDDVPAVAFSSSPQPRSPRRLEYTRRQRLRGRLGTYSWPDESSQNLDISASSASMRSKRKASSPTEQAGKLASPKSASQHNAGKVVIAIKDIFPDSTASSPRQPFAGDVYRTQRLFDISDDDVDVDVPVTGNVHSPPALLNGPLTIPDPGRAEALYRRTARPSSYESLSDPSRSPAVLIVSEPTFATDDEDIHSSQGAYRIRYLPLCSAYPATLSRKPSDPRQLTILPSHRAKIDQSQASRTTPEYVWPVDKLPVELFDLITEHLSRDDVKCMRLVNREFERKTSRSLFYTSVVPFNTELYDMIDDDKKPGTRMPPPVLNGRGKESAIPSCQGSSLSQMDSRYLQWQNAKDDKEGKVYKGHGLRVFRGFGPHIKRFGMSFEVSENQLSQPLSKKDLDHVVSYYGSYDWPSQYYTRFANLAGLENTADESSRMKAAFSNLEIVQELGLSIDNGLGWLSGPDKSVRTRLFQRPSPVFGSTHRVPDRAHQEAAEFWSALKCSHGTFGTSDNLTELQLEAASIPTSPSDILGLRDTIYADTQLWSAISHSKLASAEHAPHLPLPGVIFTTSRGKDAVDSEMMRPALVPNTLSKTQKEWLLETQWAQQAFMESYMLAVIENPANFTKVSTLNIARISSRFMSLLSRTYFWDALPSLSDVSILASADWRSVEKDDSGLVNVQLEYPSNAVRVFHKDILRDRISPRRSIKRLRIGWVGGGEHAEGMFARNSNILPAPITPIEHCTANSSVFGLLFPHVEHLTLKNCWISPPILEGLVKVHSNHALKKLTLDSVSLTTHPKFPPNQHAAHAAAAQPAPPVQLANPGPAFTQGPAFVLGGNLQPLQLPPPPNLIGLNPQQIHAAQNQWVAQVQQMQQMFTAQQNAPLGMVANQPLNFLNFPPLPPAGGANTAGGWHMPHPPAHMPAMPVPGFPAPAIPATNLPPTLSPHWTDHHREGSWPQVLDAISPGASFTDYQPRRPSLEPQPDVRATTNLRVIKLESCGYVKLPRHTAFDQSALDNMANNPDLATSQWPSRTPWFNKKHQALKGMMMDPRDRYLGNIVPAMPLREFDALHFAWGLTQGWQDEEAAEEALFDGYPPGGTGRIRGVIERGMALIGTP